MPEAGGWRSGAREVIRVLRALLLVTLGAAGILYALGLLPMYVAGEQKGVTRYRSLEEAERRLGARVRLPAYLPASLRWPPVVIRVSKAPPAELVVVLEGQRENAERLLVHRVLGARPATSRLVPRGLVLHTTTVPLPGASGRLSRIQGEDGAIWHEIRREGSGGQIGLRFNGPVEELLRMARSMRWE